MRKTIIENEKDKWVAKIFLDGEFKTLGSYERFPEALECSKLAEDYYKEIEDGRLD